MGRRNPQNAALADSAICVNESETYKVQELHLPIYHALCAAIEAEMFN
jgi:phosphoheptose isomerase